MTDLAKALKFYELVTSKYYKQEIGFVSSIFPLIYTKAQNALFLEQFELLDDAQRQLWFDHMFKQAYNSVQYEQSARSAREYVFLILSMCYNFKIKLTKDYNFEQLIKIIWVDARFRGREEENLKIAYEESGYQFIPVIDKRNGKKSNCGCLSNDCAIF